jgi:hypothetical protein
VANFDQDVEHEIDEDSEDQHESDADATSRVSRASGRNTACSVLVDDEDECENLGPPLSFKAPGETAAARSLSLQKMAKAFLESGGGGPKGWGSATTTTPAGGDDRYEAILDLVHWGVKRG